MLSVQQGRELYRREYAKELAKVRRGGVTSIGRQRVQRKAALVRAAKRTAPKRTAPIPGAGLAINVASSLIPGGGLVAGALGLAGGGGGARPSPAAVAPAGGGMRLIGYYGPYPVVILTGFWSAR